jgi:hypothetical protein
MRAIASRSASNVAAGLSTAIVDDAGSEARATAVSLRSPFAQTTISPRPIPQLESFAAVR